MSKIIGTIDISGYVRKDCFGRIIIDGCPNDEYHLQYSTAKNGDDRARCRMVLDDELIKLLSSGFGGIVITVTDETIND